MLLTVSQVGWTDVDEVLRVMHEKFGQDADEARVTALADQDTNDGVENGVFALAARNSDGGSLVGYLIGIPFVSQSETDALWISKKVAALSEVASSIRGEGIGKTLIGAALELWSAHGFSEVRAQIEPALADYYTELGFEVSGGSSWRERSDELPRGTYREFHDFPTDKKYSRSARRKQDVISSGVAVIDSSLSARDAMNGRSIRIKESDGCERGRSQGA